MVVVKGDDEEKEKKTAAEIFWWKLSFVLDMVRALAVAPVRAAASNAPGAVKAAP